MKAAAANLDFEKAAALRDQIRALRTRDLGSGRPASAMSDLREVAARSKWLKSACSRCRSTCGSASPPPGAPFSRPFYSHDLVEQIDVIGLGSLTVVLLTGFFTGAVLALQSGMTLDQFGARPFVGRLISASMIKELGPVLTALMLAGRVGSGIAAELGSMVVTEQISALRALGTDPIRKLVVPRVLAGFIMCPILTVVANTVGMLGRLDHRRDAAARARRASIGVRSSTGFISRTSGWASSSRSSSAS